MEYRWMTCWMITIASYYKGQGKMIREYRESLGLKKKPFARLMGISPNLLRAWEDHQKRMNINSWNKYFKGKIKA